MSVRDRILERFPAMSPTIRSAARFVVDHPNDVVTGSMRALAAKASVQPATLVRLAQQLGFAGWPGLKTATAADLGLNDERYVDKAKTLKRRGRRTDLAAELFDAHRRNLEATPGRDAASLAAAAALLEAARVVHVAGFRASFPIVHALFYGYRLFRGSVVLIDGVGCNLELMTRAIERTDALVVASFAPYSREAVDVAEAARDAGATIVALTDSAVSPLALLADATLLFPVESPSFFPSIVAGIALSEALVERLAAQGGPAAVRRIERSEDALRASGAYVAKR